MARQWLVSLSGRPPFVKVKRYRNEVYLINLADMVAELKHQPINISSDDSLDKLKRDMRASALYSYYLNTPAHKITDIQ